MSFISAVKKLEQTEDHHKPAKGSPVLFSVFLFLRFGLAVEKGSSPLYQEPAHRYYAETKMALAKPYFPEITGFSPTAKDGLGNLYHPGIFQKI